jgi:hypothetical protein
MPESFHIGGQRELWWRLGLNVKFVLTNWPLEPKHQASMMWAKLNRWKLSYSDFHSTQSGLEFQWRCSAKALFVLSNEENTSGPVMTIHHEITRNAHQLSQIEWTNNPIIKNRSFNSRIGYKGVLSAGLAAESQIRVGFSEEKEIISCCIDVVGFFRAYCAALVVRWGTLL